MNSLRHQQYTNLVEQILCCRQGEEMGILRRNPDLVDSGLISVMSKRSGQLCSTKDYQSYQRLLKLVENFNEVAENNYSVDFLEKILGLIYEGNNSNEIYLELNKNLHKVNERLLNILSNRLGCWLKNSDTEQYYKFPAIDSLGNLFANWSFGSYEINLELAIAAYQVVLNNSKKSEQWAATQNNIAIAYTNRIRGDKDDNFKRAIEACNEALEIYDENSEQWAMAQNNLANVYLNYGKWQDGTSDKYLQIAINACERALIVISFEQSPDGWAKVHNTLGIIYIESILDISKRSDEKAVFHFQQALRVWDFNNSFKEEWAAVQNNLGIIYSNRFDGKFRDDFEKSKNCFESCLKVYTSNFPKDWAMVQINLGTLHYKNSLFEEAIQFYESALKIYTPAQSPKNCCRTSHLLANLQSDRGNWVAAVAAYETALSATDHLYKSCLFLNTKTVELREIAELSRRAAYAHTQVTKRQTGFTQMEYLKKAVLSLEQGRARGLSESLNRDRSDLKILQQQNPILHNQYQTITQQLRNLENSDRNRMISDDRDRVPDDLINSTTKLRQALENTIAQIRQVPTYEDFLTLTKWEDIAIALCSDNPLIYIVTTPNGSVTIVVTPENIEAIWSDFNQNQLEELVQIWLNAYNNSQTDRQSWYDTIESTTRDLWDLLMGPIVQHLKSKGYDRATLIPTGYLSLLPLHAAWTEDLDRPTGKRYALDDIHVTYTPNARSLTEARKIADRVKADSILAIDDPSHGLPDIQILHNSQREIDCAIDSFSDRTVLRHGNATIDAVKSGLAKAAIVHFSCHGTANFTEPLNSGLLMSDGLLTLKDLLAQDSGIRLAILSACETGLPGLDNIDEVVSLPIGLLQAGIAGVISSLWSVSDLSTMLLLTKFYELWREQNLPPNQALRQAQIWLRDSTTEQMIQGLETVLPEFNTRQISEATARFLHDELSYKPNGQLFAHPFHWAAFSYNGV